MINLRYFTSKAQYFIYERSVGLRNFGKIEFLAPYFVNTTPSARISADVSKKTE